jgi:uncharacterized protein (TIGR02217 family)
MSFHDIRFPTRISYGSLGGPQRRTDIVTLASGHEERNGLWAHSRRHYDAGIGVLSLDDMAELVSFFEARQGQLFAFRWKDWADFKSSLPSGEIANSDQLLGTGNGDASEFNLVKAYDSGGASYVRPITKPVEDSVIVAVDDIPQQEGDDYTIDTTIGLITFHTPPAVGAQITAGYEFDVPVRFDTDRIITSLANFGAGEVPDVPIIEVRI